MALARRLPARKAAGLKSGARRLQRDGRSRGVKFAVASLASAGFVSQVQRQVEAVPRGATGLWIELADGAAMQAARVAEASAKWRRSGVRFGLQYAGTELRQLSNVHALGIDYIKVGGSVVQGIASVPALRDLTRGVVTLLRGRKQRVLVDAVQDDADIRALRSLGFDGATGPALRHAGLRRRDSGRLP